MSVWFTKVDTIANWQEMQGLLKLVVGFTASGNCRINFIVQNMLQLL